MKKLIKYFLLKINTLSDKGIYNVGSVWLSLNIGLIVAFIAFALDKNFSVNQSILLFLFPIFSSGSFFLIIPIRKVIGNYIDKKYSKGVQKLLPAEFLIDNSWVQVAMALENAENILRHAKNNRTNRTIVEYYNKAIKMNQNQFLEMDYHEVKNWGFLEDKKEMKENNELFSALWRKQLTKPGLLEKIAVLYQIDTPAKQKLFADRSDYQLIDFFSELNDFYELVLKERAAFDKYKEEYLKLLKDEKNKFADDKEKIIKKEVDNLFEMGMKSIVK